MKKISNLYPKHYAILSFAFVILSFLLMSSVQAAPSVNALKPNISTPMTPKKNSMVITDPNKTIQVRSSNPQFTITLKSNATTGYSWLLERYKPRLIVPIGKKYIPPEHRIVGAGGQEIWTFRVQHAAFVVPHLLKLKMIYAQPWNLKEGKSVVFKVATQGYTIP